jgi:hypothetical protein
VGAPAEENLRSGPSAVRLWRPDADRLLDYRPARRRWHPAPSGKRRLQGKGPFRTPCSAVRPRPLPAMMPSVAKRPSACRPGARRVEVCLTTSPISSGKRRAQGGSELPGLLPLKNRFPPGNSLPAPSPPRISFLASPITPQLPLVPPNRNAYKAGSDPASIVALIGH